MSKHQTRGLRVNILHELLSPDFQIYQSRNYLPYNLAESVAKNNKVLIFFWNKFLCFPSYWLFSNSSFIFGILLIKGYLCYKLFKICHLRHMLRIFLFHRKVMFRSQDIQVFVFLLIPRFTKSLTSWWSFFKYLLKHNSLSHPNHLFQKAQEHGWQLKRPQSINKLS